MKKLKIITTSIIEYLVVFFFISGQASIFFNLGYKTYSNRGVDYLSFVMLWISFLLFTIFFFVSIILILKNFGTEKLRSFHLVFQVVILLFAYGKVSFSENHALIYVLTFIFNLVLTFLYLKFVK